MKRKKRLYVILFFLLITKGLQSSPVDSSLAWVVARNFIKENRLKILIAKNPYKILENKDLNIPLAYVYEGAGGGFIVIAADDRISPVISYSTENPYSEHSPLESIIKSDIRLRIANFEKQSYSAKQKSKTDWLRLKKNSVKVSEYQQWPAEGTTSTGGWTTTKWNQDDPYNKFCPIKLSNNQRSMTGCPATAMAQIFNFHRTLNSTRFNSSDRYYHNYTQSFWIDDSWSTYKYLSFDSLNVYLDSIETKFSSKIELNTDEMAALSLATGFACKSVYDPAGSGTFSVNQAFAAYQRFGFTDAVLLDSSFTDEEIRQKIISNIKIAQPVHLAVVDQNWQYGHNVVCDGYRDNGFFRLNMGWGGSYDNWYNLPEGFPMSLTVFEGIVADINNNAITNKYSVCFTVTGLEQTSIEGAIISFDAIDDTLTTNANGMAFIELQDGTYSFTVEADSYQSYSNSFVVNGDSVDVDISLLHVGVEISQEPTINAYPNPFDRSLFVTNAKNFSRIVITSITGNPVVEKKVTGIDRVWISISDLTSGCYLLIIETENGKRFSKVIVKE